MSSLHAGDPFVDKSKHALREAGGGAVPWKASTVSFRVSPFLARSLVSLSSVHTYVE